MIELAIIIIHYITTEDTLACIRSIKRKLDCDNYKILIVDNASPNDSFIQLNRNYALDESVVIIKMNCNEGYARACNKGIEYVVDKFNPEYIIVANNDVQLIDLDSFNIIKKMYEKYSFAVMGPMLLTSNGMYNSNPIAVDRMTRDELILAIRGIKRLLFCYKYHVEGLYRMFKTGGKIRHITNVNQNNVRHIEVIENVVLHGAFLIFSPKYFDKFDGLDDRTFLYNEEFLLHLNVTESGMKTLYCPYMHVYHIGSSSTNTIKGNKRSREIESLKNHLDSYNVLLSTYEKLGVN